MTDLETLRAVAALDDAGRVIPARDVIHIPVLTNTGLDPAIRRGRIGEIKLACPRCGSFHLTAYNLEADGDTIRAAVLICHECKAVVPRFMACGRNSEAAA